MSEPNLVNVWIYQYVPHEWHCQTFEGIVGIGRTREEAKATFDRDWNQRAPYRLIEGHPPRQRRGDEPKPGTPAVEDITRKERIERVTECFRRWSKRLHPDVHSGDTLATEAMAALTELYELAKQ